MSEMIETRKTSEKKDQQFDLFTSLLNANEGNETKLTESELIGIPHLTEIVEQPTEP
jgi:hypothetical protein